MENDIYEINIFLLPSSLAIADSNVSTVFALRFGLLSAFLDQMDFTYSVNWVLKV